MSCNWGTGCSVTVDLARGVNAGFETKCFERMFVSFGRGNIRGRILRSNIVSDQAVSG